MNKKGEINGIGLFLIAFVGIIVALGLYSGIGAYVGQATGVTQSYIVNSTVTFPADGGALELTGQEYVTTAVVYNATSITVVPTTNYSIVERVNSDGVKGIALISTISPYAGKSVNISYGYYADGYVDDAGSRSMVLLIPIMAVLAIVMIAMVPALRNGLMDMIS